MNSNATAQYIVRHEVYESLPDGFGRILAQEWEEIRTLPAFFKPGDTDYHEGNRMHLVSIEAFA